MGADRVTVQRLWDVRSAVVSGKQCEHLVLLQVVAEDLSRCPGSAGEPLRGSDAGVAGIGLLRGCDLSASGVELDIHYGAHAAKVEAVLRAVRSC